MEEEKICGTTKVSIYTRKTKTQRSNKTLYTEITCGKENLRQIETSVARLHEIHTAATKKNICQTNNLKTHFTHEQLNYPCDGNLIQHSPEVCVMNSSIPLQSLWIQENKLCQQQIIMVRGRQIHSISSMPHGFLSLFLRMRCHKKWTIRRALISCIIIPYR